jgi:hypothetical protein
MMGMSLDDVLIAVLLGGAGLSAAYVRAEYIRWRQSGAEQLRRESMQNELHAARLTQQQMTGRALWALPLRKFQVGKAAGNDASSTSRSRSRDAAQASYAFFERRKTPRSHNSSGVH